MMFQFRYVCTLYCWCIYGLCIVLIIIQHLYSFEHRVSSKNVLERVNLGRFEVYLSVYITLIAAIFSACDEYSHFIILIGRSAMVSPLLLHATHSLSSSYCSSYYYYCIQCVYRSAVDASQLYFVACLYHTQPPLNYYHYRKGKLFLLKTSAAVIPRHLLSIHYFILYMSIISSSFFTLVCVRLPLYNSNHSLLWVQWEVGTKNS